MGKLFFIFLISMVDNTYASDHLYMGDLDRQLNVTVKHLDGEKITKPFLDKEAKYYFDIHAVLFRQTNWDEEKLGIEFETTAEAFAKCGITLGNITIYTSDPYEENLIFDIGSRTTKELARNISQPLLRRPLIFFIQEMTISGYGASIFIKNHKEMLRKGESIYITQMGINETQWNEMINSRFSEFMVPIVSPDANTIWIVEDAINRPGFQRTLAHELGHIFMQDEHHSKLFLNLMTPRSGIDLSTEQCGKIVGSPYIRAVRH